MTFDQALAYFKTGRAIAEALGVSPGRISQCKARGWLSFPHQCVLEKVSGGHLSALEEDDLDLTTSSADLEPILPSDSRIRQCADTAVQASSAEVAP